MAEVGYATLGIIPSFDGFQGKLEAGTSRGMLAAGTSGGTRFGDAAGKSAGSRFGSVFKTAAKASLLGLAGAGALAVKFGSDAVSAASDLEESTNKVSQVFGDNAAEIFKFTEAAGDALGQTNTQAREAAATFGIFGNAAGLADKKNAKFAQRMTTLASDLASFNNTEPEEAVQALGAALRGESEPIRAYGVLLDEATLKAEALRLGILKPVQDESKILAYQTNVTVAQRDYNKAVEESGKGSLDALKAQAALGTAQSSLAKATEGVIPPLNQQQKLLAAQSQIFKQTEVAQGDFARTSDGLANQQRRLAARFENAKAALGTGLLPIMTQAADFLLDEGIPAFEDFAEWFNEKGIPKLKEFGGFVKDDVIPVVKDLAEFAGDAAGFVGDLVGAFNKLPSGAKLATLGAVFAGGAALKMRGGGGGALGLAGSALGMAKPVPVFVTNPGGIGGVGGKTGVPPVVAGAPKGALPRWAPILPALGSDAAGQDSLMRSLFGFGLKGSDEAIRIPVTPVPASDSDIAAIKETWITQADSLAGVMDKFPKTLQRRFELLGVPESEEDLRHLLRVYEITAKDRRTTLELMGYDVMLDRIARINKELDWAARPREARISITKAYAAAGYQTRGGLQEGGGGPVERNRSRAGGGLG